MRPKKIPVEYYDGAAVLCPISDTYVSIDHCQACKHFQSLESPHADVSSGNVKVLCGYSKGGTS